MEISERQYRQIENEVNPPKPLQVTFYNKPKAYKTVNGISLYEPQLMAVVKVKGENSSISKVATEQLKAEYQQEYQFFKDRQFEGLTPLCAITDEMTAQSLIEMGIKSVDDLAESEPLPLFDHLRETAKQLLELKNGTHTDRCEQHNNQERVQRATEESPDNQRAARRDDSIGREHISTRSENQGIEKNHKEENHQKIGQEISELTYSLEL